ncbi:hypothetical protein [Priestia megaterium]|uniref:hypothetical protein n=1 Tax=Priestia megaterium TaxID=1404 RepID=UPI00203F6326|nr:hypothetical protein [Priestia megaterium]MCM3544080.1 hypothetical protein [Priestia megaterium]
MASAVESFQFRQLLLQSLNSLVEIVTDFGLVTGKVVQIQIFDVPLDYVILKESENGYVYVPLFAIDSLIVIQKDGDLE